MKILTAAQMADAREILARFYGGNAIVFYVAPRGSDRTTTALFVHARLPGKLKLALVENTPVAINVIGQLHIETAIAPVMVPIPADEDAWEILTVLAAETADTDLVVRNIETAQAFRTLVVVDNRVQAQTIARRLGFSGDSILFVHHGEHFAGLSTSPGSGSPSGPSSATR